MLEELSDGTGRVGYRAVAPSGERILLLLGILGWLGGVLYAAPIALFGGIFPMYLWLTSRSGSVKAAAGSLVISCLVAALINWFFLGGVGVIAVWRDVMG